MPIDEAFKKLMQSNVGVAVILMGSDSDDKSPGKDEKGNPKHSHIEKIVSSLETYEIPYEVRVRSAHKQDAKEIIGEYNAVGGSVAFVAVAGGEDALSGTASYHALGLVISCPPDAPNDSCTRNPPGSSNAYIPRPENVGKAIAQAFAGINSTYREILELENERKVAKLIRANGEIQAKYAARRLEKLGE